MERTLFRGQRSDEPPADARGNLEHALDHSAERGRWAERGHVAEHSPYTAVTAGLGGRLLAGLTAAALGLALGARIGGRLGADAEPPAEAGADEE
jgi:hypothetical protein